MQAENFAQIASQHQPMLGQAPHCGDGVWTCWHNQTLFGLLCDGAGHGVEAERIQQQAIAVARSLIAANAGVEKTDEKVFDGIDLVALFHALHKRLRGSRGMVAVAFVLHADGAVDFIHIGDVSLCNFQAGFAQMNRSTEQQGIIGYHMPIPRVQHWQCEPGQWLVAHSDGIRRSTASQAWQRLLQHGHTMSTVSLNIMRELADGRDDASCIVLRYWGERQVLLHGLQEGLSMRGIS